MGVEPSRRFKPEACQKCGWVTKEVRNVEIDGKRGYYCPECRGFGKKDEKSGRRARLEKLYKKELI